MKIVSIVFNWYFSPADNGEGWEKRTVGEIYGGVECTEIIEHSAAGEGDRWYYDIKYADGSMERTFNPNHVNFK